MVCTSQALAAQAGLEILKKGGNAIDSAIATAICLTVTEPTSNGIGSDAFAIIWFQDKLYGFNGSGMAPAKADVKKLKELGYDTMPMVGWYPVTVPGAPSAWIALSKRFGKLPFADLFQQAIAYAQEGFPVSPTVSQLWKKSYDLYREKGKNKEEFDEWFATFAPKGHAPSAGEIWKSPNHAKTLQELAETCCESFYKGEIAEKIHAFSSKYHGWLCKQDLENHEPLWVEPISIGYKGYDIWEIPPNGHGIVALMALNMIKNASLGQRDSQSYHEQIEAMKLAFADGKNFIADNRYMKATIEQLLSEEYGKKRWAEISDRAKEPVFGDPFSGGTVYLCTADEEGNMVSYIQSNYDGFGSGLVVPGTGIALHNRGANFSLDEAHVNCLAPNKRPYHTIIPGFLTKDKKAVGPFGVMGGFMQPQGHMQVMMNMIDFHMNPQEALDAPRWQWTGGKRIMVERQFPFAITEKLLHLGHEIIVEPEDIEFGRGQMIVRNDDGVLAGATEPRADGVVAAW